MIEPRKVQIALCILLLLACISCKDKEKPGIRTLHIQPGKYNVFTLDSLSINFELNRDGSGKKELWSKGGTCSFIEGRFRWEQYKDILLITDIYDSVRTDFCNPKWQESAVFKWAAFKLSKISDKGFLAVSPDERDYFEFKKL